MTANISPRTCLSLLVGLASLLVLLEGTQTGAFAYGDKTHELLTSRAFQFLLDQQYVPKEKYPRGWTSEDDYKLGIKLKKILDPAKLQKLINYTSYTDYFADVVFRTPFGERWELSGNSFTAFSHFLNIRRAGDMWDKNGYYYPWVSIAEQCTQFKLSNLVNTLIEYGFSTVIPDRTLAYARYKHGLKGTETEYQSNFRKYIRDVRFWPAASMAEFWYQEVLSSPVDEVGLPLNLHFIASAFHVVQDLSVPYHSVGISGCGHEEFEDYIEVQPPHSLYDPAQVRRHLRASHLDHSQPVSTIAAQIAGIAAKHCKEDFVKHLGQAVIRCDHLARPTEMRRVAKEMFNLAVAGTVVVIRKAIIEWEAKVGPVREGSPGKENPASLSKSTGRIPRESEAKSEISPAQRPIGKGQPGQLVQPTAPSFPERIFGPSALGAPVAPNELTTVYRDIIGYFDGRVPRSSLQTRLTESSEALVSWLPTTWLWSQSALVDVSAMYPGSPPVLAQKTREFRLPTLAETENPSLWWKYVSDRKKHTEALKLMRLVGVNRYLQAKFGPTAKSELRRNLEAAVQSTIERNVAPPLQNIEFAFDSYALSSDAKRMLRGHVAWLQRNPDRIILVEGHSEEAGTHEYNMALAAKRAQAVKDLIISLGVSPERVLAVGYGEETPVCVERGRECQGKNARVTFTWR